MKRWLRQLPARLSARPLTTLKKCKWPFLTTALLLAGWVAGLFLFFPAAALENRIENEVTTQLRGQGRLDLSGLSLTLPLGLSARQATVILNQSPLGEIVVTDFRVKPLWLSLLTDNPGLAFAGDYMGGQAEGFLRRQGDIQLEATGIQLAFPLLNNAPLAVAGTLEEGRLSGQWPPAENSPSHLSLHIKNTRVTGLSAIGATRETLELGTLVLQGNGTGNSFKLESIESRDGQISMTGSGALLLVNPMTKSRINLSGVLVPAADLDPQLRDLLGMVVKEVAGSFPVSVSGTLSRPQIK